jgi:hypothetical protein
MNDQVNRSADELVYVPLPGEGEVQTITRTRLRHACENCGEPATKRHTYLHENARRNPASSAYGRDDCTWCSDHEEFTCNTCKRPSVEGMGWCSTFGAERFPHMFLFWHEEKPRG